MQKEKLYRGAKLLMGGDSLSSKILSASGIEELDYELGLAFPEHGMEEEDND
jgi:hypothetical protein